MPPFRHGLPAQGVEAVDINRVYRRAWDYMDDYMILNMTQNGVFKQNKKACKTKRIQVIRCMNKKKNENIDG